MALIPSNVKDFETIETFVKSFLREEWEKYVKAGSKIDSESQKEFLYKKRLEYLKSINKDQLKIYREGIAKRKQQEAEVQTIQTKRRNRANNTAKVVPIESVLPKPAVPNVGNGEININQFRRFENIRLPLPKRPTYTQNHPGYKYVSTRGNGSCMYFSIYFAQHPELSTDAPEQTDERALEIRKLIADEANIEDVQSFDANSFALSIQMEKDARVKANLKRYQDKISAIDKQLAPITPPQNIITPEMVPLLNQKLSIYKELLMLHTFWGENREIAIWNRIVENQPERGWKKIYVWVEPYMNYLGYIPGGVPIHFNGYGHYSILSPIKAKDAEAIREEEDRRWATYSTEYEVARQKEQELRGRWRAKYGDDPRWGGKRKTRKLKKNRRN